MSGRAEDRRGRPRYDIVGDMPATLEVVARFPIENIGPGGAKFRSRVPLAIGSVHRFTLLAGGDEFNMQVKVRYAVPAPGADAPPSFVIGVEFLSMPRGLMSAIQHAADTSASDLPEA